MKNPTYAKFMDEVEQHISNLTGDELKKIIFNLAESQNQSDRNEFLQKLKGTISPDTTAEVSEDSEDISPKKLIKEIKEYEQRILDGEFYDEEADCEKLIDLIFEHDKIISWW